MNKQVKELVKSEISINKSKFISFLFPVSSLEEIKIKLNEFKTLYKDSTHICYSYILDENTFKYYDDGEPSSTAGAPIYQVLKNNNLIYTMCVVIRYYGGIKLGVGGLIKAYTNSCLECLKIASISDYEELETCSFTVDYANYEKIEYYLKNNDIQIINKSFEDEVTLTIRIKKGSINNLKNTFFNHIKSFKTNL